MIDTGAQPPHAQGIDRLLKIMQQLRDPESGCPWDLEQTFETVAPYTIEEAYEVADAIAQGNLTDIKAELGDLLLQVVFHAQMAQEQKAFDFDSVAHGISDKMIRRHPHVFGPQQKTPETEAVNQKWEDIKAEERAEKAAHTDEAKPESVLDDVPSALPALIRAVKLQKRAARVGFDWPDVDQVLDKIEEELAEFRSAIVEAKNGNGDIAAVLEELGDVMFVYANVARHLSICPEEALRKTNLKFTRRFQQIEAWLHADGRTPEQSTLAEMDDLWNRAKKIEKQTVQKETT